MGRSCGCGAWRPFYPRRSVSKTTVQRSQPARVEMYPSLGSRAHAHSRAQANAHRMFLAPRLEHAHAIGVQDGQLLYVTGLVQVHSIHILRAASGEMVDGWLRPESVCHGFAGWLPLHAACALGSDDTIMALVEAAPDAVAADGRNPLHLVAAAARSADLTRSVLAANQSWARQRDADGLLPLQLLPPWASGQAAAVLFDALGPETTAGAAVGADGRTLLHIAAAISAPACSPDLFQRMLAAVPSWAKQPVSSGLLSHDKVASALSLP